MSDENIVIAVQDKVDASVAAKIQQIANSAREASTAVQALQAGLASLGGITELNAALETSQANVTGLQNSMSSLTSQTTTLTTAVVDHTSSVDALSTAETAAAERIKAMVAASLEAHAAMTDNTTAAAAYAASVDEMAAAATLAERSNVGIATSATEATVAQTEAAAAFTAASTTISASAASVAEALGRQLTALTATKAQMVEYDAQMAGMTAAETAQLTAIAEEIDLRKQQMVLGAQMAAVYEAEAAAAGTAKVATSGVTSELFVLGREAASGNYTKLAGSFTRFLSLAGALQLLLNPVSIGLIAVGGSFLYVANQNDKMNQALELTGNYAGLTTDQLRDMATAATAGGASFGVAVQAMTELANTGRLTGQEIGQIGATIATMASITGESVTKMVGEFTKLGEDPVKASVKLNEQYNYLTASVYDQIVALQKQGDETGAAQLAVETFANVMNDRTADIQKNQGAIITGWHAIKDAIGEAVQAVGNFGSKSPENVMDQLQLRKNGQVANGVWTPSDEAELQAATQAYIKSVTDAQNQLATQAQQKQLITAKQAYASWNEQFATPAEKRAEAIQKYLDNIATPLGLSPEQQLSDQDKIDNKYKDKKPSNAAHRQQQNELSAQMVALQQYSDGAKALYQQQTADLQTALNTQQITQQQYIVQLGEDKQKELQTLINVAQKEADLALGKDQLSARQKYLNEVKKYQADLVTSAAQTQAQLSALNAKTTFDALKQLQSLQQVGQQRDSSNQNTLDSAGLGSKEIADITTLQAVANRAAQARLALTQQAEKDGTQYSTAYINGIKAINDEEANQLANEKIFFQARDEMQSNWMNGVTAGMQNFIDTSENVAASAQQAFTSAFTGINNALATFVTTGKLNFSSLANSIIGDIIKIQLQSSESTILKALMGVASTGASDYAGSFGFSGGGSASAVGSGLSALFGASGYAAGGYTGNGGVNEPAGVVHGKEFVVNAQAVAQPGVMQMLTALNNGKKGYADGGYVGIPPTIQSAPVQSNMTVNIVNNASDQVAVTAKQGTDSAGNPTLEVMANLLEGQLAGKIASGRGKLHDSISTKFGLQSRPGRA